MSAWHSLGNKHWLGVALLVASSLVLAWGSPVLAQQEEWVRVFADDFESGRVQAWSITAGKDGATWWIGQEAGGHFLASKGELYFQALTPYSSPDYALGARVSLNEGSASIRFRFTRWQTDNGIASANYGIILSPKTCYLKKYVTLPGSPTQVTEMTSAPAEPKPGTWHRVNIRSSGNQLYVEIDGVMKLQYVDAREPTLSGSGMMLGCNPASYVLFDDAEIRGPQEGAAAPARTASPTPAPTQPSAPAATPQPAGTPQTSTAAFSLPFELDTRIILSSAGSVVAAVAGLTAWAIRRRSQRAQARHMRNLLDEMDGVYAQFKMNTRRCEAELHRLRGVIADELKRGNLTEQSYAILDKRLDSYMREIQEQIIDERFGGFPARLKNALYRMVRESEIGEQDFDSMEKLLLEVGEVSDADRAQLKELLTRWRESYLKKERLSEGE